MSVDTTHARVVATRVRRQTNNRDILDLCDYVLDVPQIPNTVTLKAMAEIECPVCAQRRASKAASQRKFRKSQKSG